MPESARLARSASNELADGRMAERPRPPGGAGNAAVNALLLGRLKAPGRAEIDAALDEMRRGEPVIDTVEKGLMAAKSVGVPVDLEGAKPPPSALAATTTGFGPASVAPKKPVPPPKPVPAKSPLGMAAAKRVPGGGAGARGAAPMAAPTGGGAMAGPAPLSAGQLLQPPVPPKPVKPEQDPAFKAVTSNVNAFAKEKRAHPPAAAKAKEAQGAAVAPADDIAGQAKAAKVDTMDAQQAGSFDKKAFIAAVKAAIEAKSPKTLSEADSYAESGKAGEVKGEVKGLVTQGKQGQAKDITAATAAPPDPSKAVPKPVTPMGPEQQGPAAAIPAIGAAPKPAPPEQVNLEAGKQQANKEMADAEVSEQQLTQSNEPQFQQALTDKKAAAAHADTAPGEYRQREQDIIGQGKTEAAAATTAGVAGMQGAKDAALAKLVAAKGKTKSHDEAKRAEVTTKVQAIYAAAETDVKKILDGIDPKVEKAFEEGEADARKSFETYVSAKMSAYKQDRYSGWLGGLRWAKDKLLGMPDKVNKFYEAGRELYLRQMDTVVSRVADIVGNDLTAAKKRIASGKAEIATYVKSLPAGLQKVGAEASKDINDKFAQLESDVNSKQQSVVDTLATKYVAARKGLDERIEELQAANKGLVDKAIGAIKAVIDTIRKLASMLKDTLSRAAHVVGDIVKHPIRFLGNLIAGVKGGIFKFKDNILEHLRKGLMSWLLGALAQGGVELPDEFDLQGIIKLLASLFGLTWRNIRSRIVKQIGEEAMSAVEKGVEIFKIISTAGVAGLWQMLMEKLGDIKEMILEQIKDFVITKIIKAGITWLITLLNPVGAFIKACKLIYDIIMFFVNNAARILKFVNTVIDSAADIVRGNIGGVVAKIEDVLGQMVPILIGFLASVLGIGGIGEKIREIIGKLQKPVTTAIDFVIEKGLKLAGPIIAGLRVKVQGMIAGKRAPQSGSAAATPSVADTPQSSAIKAAALNDAVSRIKSAPPESPGGLRVLLGKVLDARRAQGLKDLQLRAAGPDSLALRAEASSPQELTLLWHEAFKAHPVNAIEIIELREQFKAQGWDTVASVTVDGKLLGSTSSDGNHAEQKILTVGLWDRALKLARDRVAQSGSAEIAILINRSPCHSLCTPELVKALHEPKAKIPGVRFVLAATGTYEPTYDIPSEELQKDAQDFAKRHGLSLAQAMKSVAKRGNYKDPPGTSKKAAKGGVTTNKDIASLSGAGWILKGLVVADLSERGRQWLQGIENFAVASLNEEIAAKK
jgi:hypothetical protein